MVNYKKDVKKSAQNLLIKEWGGLGNLAASTVGGMSGNDTLYKGCLRIAKNTLVYTSDRRAWLARRDIKPRDVDGAFNSLFAGECYDLVYAYIKRHKLAILKKGYGFTLVKA